MLKVLMTGASGLVGARVKELLKTDFTWLTPSSQELDITDKDKTLAFVQSHDFDCFLHLAAYTNVDQAEIEHDYCRKINVEGTANTFRAVNAVGKRYILVSTDFVFDGTQPEYNEKSIPKPLSYYGQTKFEAEQLVKNQAMIVRLSYPYGNSPAPKPDFVRTILKFLKQGQSVQGITDLIFTPTFLDDIAFGLKYLINHFQPLIYHLVGSESLSPYEAFIRIADTFAQDKNLVKPTTYEQYFLNKAPRPKNAKMTTLYQFYQTHDFSHGLSLVKEYSS